MRGILSKTSTKVIAFVLIVIFAVCTIICGALIITAYDREVYYSDSIEELEDNYVTRQLNMMFSYIFEQMKWADSNELENSFIPTGTNIYFEVYVNENKVAGTYNNEEALAPLVNYYSVYMYQDSSYLTAAEIAQNAIISEPSFSAEVNDPAIHDYYYDDYSSNNFEYYYTDNTVLTDIKIVIYPQVDFKEISMNQNGYNFSETIRLFEYRYTLIGLAVSFISLALICFVLLLVSAGRKQGVDCISLNAYDKIPFDLLLVIYIIGFIFLSAISIYYVILLISLVVYAIFLIPLFMSLSARIKKRKLVEKYHYLSNYPSVKKVIWKFQRHRNEIQNVKTSNICFNWLNLNRINLSINF